MNLRLLCLTVLTSAFIGSIISASGQTTVYEQSRSGSTGSGANNPDFTFNGFTSTLSANKSTAPGIPSGSTSSRLASTSIAAGAGTNFVLSPNHTTAGQLVNGTTYAVAITFGSTGNNESSDLVVTTSDTQTSGNDTFAGTSSAFKNANGYNAWITIGNITINGSLPTFTFAYLSGTNPRWYVDTVRFTPLPPLPTAQYWDTGSIGGSGIWDASTTANWNTSSTGSGTQGFYTQGDLSVFGGTAGTVSIDPVNGITTDGGLEFDTTGYIIQSGPLTLGLGTNIAVVGGANMATINSVVTGVNGLCTTGLGTLVLNNTNNLTGTVTLSAGVLSLGTNQTFTSLVGNPSATLALNTNTLTVGDPNSTTNSAVITDSGASTPGSLVKQGSGLLALAATSTYHGSTAVNAGTLSIAADTALGTAPASAVANQIVLNGGRLDFSASIALAANRGIALGASGGMLSTPGSGTTVTLPGNITGPGSLTVPSGAFDFTGTNTFSGNIYLTGTTVDTGGNNLISLRFDASGTAGTGKIFVSPTNPINVTLRTFTGTNVVITNALEFDSGGIFLSGAIASSKICTINFAGNINGTTGVTVGNPLALESSPGGTVVLSGSNSLWSGSTLLQVGTLGVGSSNALGTGGLSLVPTAGSNIVLMATTPLTGASALQNAVAINSANGPIAIGGTNNIELAGPVALYGSSTISANNTGASIISGSIADSTPASGFSLTTAGTGTLTLSGANSYDGGTTVSTGTLNVNNTTGSGTGTGAVIVSSGAILEGSGIISGTVDLSGAIAPGSTGPGALSTADETWEGGASYTFAINKAGGTAGANPGWSQANITGGLNINASSGSPFTINLTSLTLANAPGVVSDFNSAHTYTWSIAHTTTGITNFSTNAFTLNTAGFSNSLGSGSFSITTNATDVLLVFTAPTTAPTIGSIHVSGTSLTISGTGGIPSGAYRVLTSTNVTAHLATWTQAGTGSFDGSGNFTYNGSITPGDKQQFYVVVSP